MKLHDLHHVLTGYAADWTGEAEIAAWELGAGCGGHVAAWILNAAALQYGLFIAPRAVLAAMARGRRSRSLYEARELDESMLEEPVGDARARLGIPEDTKPGIADVVALAAWWIGTFVMWTAPLAGVVSLVRSAL